MAGATNAPRLFGRHHEGRQAEAALGVIEPVLSRHESDLLEAAKERYRAGHRDPQEALLALSQLVALDDLRRALEHAVKQGNRAMERMIEESSRERG